MKQERDLTGVGFIVDSNSEDILQSKNSKQLSPEENAQLEAIVSRKAQLLKKVSSEDYQRLKELIEITKGQQLSEVSDLDSKGLDRLLNIFHDMTYIDASQQIAAVVSSEEDELVTSKKSAAKKGAKSMKDQKQTIRQSLKQSKTLKQVL